jgi:drug/metabolite transporter (DMT)-like permease
MIQSRPLQVVPWLLLGSTLSAAGALLIISLLGENGAAPLVQVTAVSLLGGTLAVWAYLAGIQQTAVHKVQWRVHRWHELFRFWWWPGLVFAATYYLVLAGTALFLVPAMNLTSAVMSTVMAGTVGSLMTVYGYYFGQQRHLDDQIRQSIPPLLLRCPFVMGILSRQKSHAGLQRNHIGAKHAESSL